MEETIRKKSSSPPSNGTPSQTPYIPMCSQVRPSPQLHYSFIRVSSTCSCPQNGGRNSGNVPQDASSILLPTRTHFLIELNFCTGITILMALVLLPLVALSPSSCRARPTVIGRWPPRVSPSLRCKLISVSFSAARY